MNATLQCLANNRSVLRKVLEYYLSGKLDKDKHKLSYAYAEVLKEIYMPHNNNKRSYSPNRFKEVLGKMNSLFAPTAANDAKDLLIYFIEQMHNELNKSQEENTNLVMPDNIDSKNQEVVFNSYMEEFKKKYESVFSDHFYGTNVSITHCNGCNINKYSTQCFSFIIFPLLEAAKYCGKAFYYNGKWFPDNKQILNLKDCFNYNDKVEYFAGDNQMYCNTCRRSANATMQTKIDIAPNTLILILNRGRGNLDYQGQFKIQEQIDLSEHVIHHTTSGEQYYLSGVVSHMGESGLCGHFISYCRTSPYSTWHCYNDSLVTGSSLNEINSRGIPYMLFYTKIGKQNNNQNMNMMNNMGFNNQNNIGMFNFNNMNNQNFNFNNNNLNNNIMNNNNINMNNLNNNLNNPQNIN